MWSRNWFCPAYFAKKRSRSESPERNAARPSDSRSALISIALHQVAQGLGGLARRLQALEHLLEGLLRQHQAWRDHRVSRQLVERTQVVAQRRLDQVTLL